MCMWWESSSSSQGCQDPAGRSMTVVTLNARLGPYHTRKLLPGKKKTRQKFLPLALFLRLARPRGGFGKKYAASTILYRTNQFGAELL